MLPDPLRWRPAPVALAVVLTASGCAAFAEIDPAARRAIEPLTREAVAVTPSPLPSARTRAARRPRVSPSPSPQVRETSASNARAAAKPTVLKLRPRPRAGAFEMNLYRAGDFVHQATKDWCVAGSTQTMMNIIDEGKPNRSTRFQERLYRKGRQLSPNKAKLGPIGIDLTGWAELLNTAGYGPYAVAGADTRRAAIHKAARALRETGRPVGLVTWRGAHSWVMSGFTATADPAYRRHFKVKKVYIQDVWYPYVSTIWGASRPPNALVPVAALAEDYLPYRRPRARYPKRDGRFMLILPVLPAGTVAR